MHRRGHGPTRWALWAEVRILVAMGGSGEPPEGLEQEGEHQTSLDKDPFGCLKMGGWEGGSVKMGAPGRRQLQLGSGGKALKAGSGD